MTCSGAVNYTHVLPLEFHHDDAILSGRSAACSNSQAGFSVAYLGIGLKRLIESHSWAWYKHYTLILRTDPNLFEKLEAE
jgi:hypothetical protein